ncbi:HAMP domain-containing sensor histidine kinase [Synechocystis sp. LKSZ1]|uniref:sensor histidine kinase n=1 Tax=Synechocystis sp. LKSZ1 TaxID=3144951 RepID=UPI00336C07AF
MAWDIDLTPISDQRFSQLRRRLLSSYLLVIATILGGFSVTVYALVAHERNQQFNQHLHQSANSSASLFAMIKHEYEEVKTDLEEESFSHSTAAVSMPRTLTELMHRSPEAAIPLPPGTSSMTAEQGVEWYDAQQQQLVRDGGLFPSTPLPKLVDPAGQWEQQGSTRSFIHPVYRDSIASQATLLGYVRVTESTLALEAELRRLRWGLVLGGLAVSGLAMAGGVWLTRVALRPITQSFQQLQQFTADASHELRSPLTAIRASIAVMQSHPERIHAADVDKLAAVAEASTQMSRLVEELLLLARMDQQAPDQQGWQRVALDEILEDLVDLYHDQAEQAQLALQTNLMSPVEIRGDVAHLQRLFTNLLANALHYTPSGGSIFVSLQVRGNYAFTEIKDTGIGISPEQLPHIFKRFWRADQARRHDNAGSGLGLAIAKSIVQCHGGEIIVRSEMGVGTSFQIKLPLS